MRHFPRFRTLERPHAAGRALRPAAVLALAAALPVLLAACAGSEGAKERAAARAQARAAAGCNTLDTTTIVRDAVLQLIATTQPKPLRFLYIPGTDSTPPEGGVRALQDKGPTYLYATDSVNQRKVRDKLSTVGPWTALLVVYKGIKQPNPETASVYVGGHFVGAENDGQVVPVREFRFTCRTVGDSAYKWHPADTAAAGTPAQEAGT